MSLSLAQGLTLYFCRHGETEANVERRFQGHTRDTPLTAKGIEQARGIARILAHEMPDFARLAFVSSPLERAQATMRFIREALGLTADGYAIDPRTVEINLGEWDGLTLQDVRALDPVAYEVRTADKWNVRVPGGENYADVARRCEAWVGDLRVDTFAVTHGAFLRVLRGLFQGMTWQQMSALDEPQGVLFRARGSAVDRLEP